MCSKKVNRVQIITNLKVNKCLCSSMSHIIIVLSLLALISFLSFNNKRSFTQSMCSSSEDKIFGSASVISQHFMHPSRPAETNFFPSDESTVLLIPKRWWFACSALQVYGSCNETLAPFIPQVL